MKKDVIIIGGGGFAYECYIYLHECIDAGENFTFKGFAAPECPTLKNYGLESLNLGDESTIENNPNDVYVIGIGSPATRKKVFESLISRGKTLVNLIHPSARISDFARKNMGNGNVFAYSTINSAISVGDCNVVNTYSGFAHDSVIGSFNVLSSFCSICGHAQVGDLNFFGTNAVMLPSAKIGDSNQIAAGSIVYKGCKSNCIMLGNPAEKIGKCQ